MNYRRRIVCAIALAMTMLVTHLAYAQGPAKGPDKRAARRAELRAAFAATPAAGKKLGHYSQEELEQMRTALLDLASTVKDLTELAPNSIDAGKLDEATRQVAELSYPQLGELRQALNPVKISESLATSRASIAEFKLSLQRVDGSQNEIARRKKGEVVGIESAGFPVVLTFCGAPLGPGRIPTATVLAADVTFFIAEGIWLAAEDACNQVILGESVGAACIAATVLYVAAQAVDAGIHFCDDDLTGGIVDANYLRLDHIHTDLENSVANDNSNKNTIISNISSSQTAVTGNDNVNKTMIINNANANTTTILNAISASQTAVNNNTNAGKNELRDLILRTQIEADLASTDGSTFVALYLTPTANGGYLDLVMTIVTQTLANIQAAGGNIGNAQTVLNQANAAKTSGDFKGAYTLYRKAYKTAAK